MTELIWDGKYDKSGRKTAAHLWAENATRLTNLRWQYITIPQAEFIKLQPGEFTALLALSHSGLDLGL